MKKLLFALTCCFTALTSHAAVNLIVQGPETVTPGEVITLNYFITFDTERVGGAAFTIKALPEGVGEHIQILSTTFPNLQPGYFVDPNNEIGALNQNRSFSFDGWNRFDPLSGEQPLLIVTQDILVSTETPFGSYTIEFDPFDIDNWDSGITSWHDMDGEWGPTTVFDNISSYTFNVIPEPSTYAVGIGIVALITTAVIRRRNKRSLEVVNFVTYKEAA